MNRYRISQNIIVLIIYKLYFHLKIYQINSSLNLFCSRKITRFVFEINEDAIISTSLYRTATTIYNISITIA